MAHKDMAILNGHQTASAFSKWTGLATVKLLARVYNRLELQVAMLSETLQSHGHR